MNIINRFNSLRFSNSIVKPTLNIFYKDKFYLFLFNCLIVLILNYFLNTLFYKFFDSPISLKEIDYFSSSIIYQSIKNLNILSILAILCLPLFILWNRVKWSKLDLDILDRSIIFFIIGLLAWILAFSDYNLYYDQPYYIERISLVILFFLIFFNPSFLPVFICLALIFLNQLNYPLSQHWISEKGTLIDMLILAVSVIFIMSVNKRLVPGVFFFLVVLIFVQNYFWAGITKIDISPDYYDWIVDDKVKFYIIDNWLKGWLNHLSFNELTQFYELIDRFNVPINFLILVLELCTAIIFFHRRFFASIILGCVALNITIFLFTSILFWEWIILGLLFVIIVYKKDKNIFQSPRAVLFICLLVFAPEYLNPHYLGWFDKPLTNIVQVEVVSEDGNVYEVRDNYFSPYDRIFEYDEDFLFLVNKNLISDYSYKTYNNLVNIDNINDFVSYQKENGENNYNERKIKRFEAFLLSYFSKLENRIGDHKWIKPSVGAPLHHQHMDGDLFDSSQFNFRIKEIRVVYYQYLMIDDGYKKVSSDLVYSLNLST